MKFLPGMSPLIHFELCTFIIGFLFGINFASADAVPPVRNVVEFFSSTKKLSALYQQEGKYVEEMVEFLTNIEKTLEPMKKYIKHRQLLESMAITPLTVPSHPVDAYVLIRRFTTDWQEIILQLEIAMSYMKGYVEWSKKLQFSHSEFPKQSDLAGAALGLVRLQNDYKLDFNDLENGIVKSPAFNNEFRGIEKLMPYDLQHLGIRSAETGYNYSAVGWFELALRRYEELGTAADVEIIREQYLQAVKVNDGAIEEKKNGSEFVPMLHQDQTFEQITDHYARLCRGERLRNSTEESFLWCHLRSPHPSLLLQPIKIEEMNLEPYIIIIHDLLSTSQTEKIINLTDTHELFRSRHVSTEDESGNSVTSDSRTSQNVWLGDGHDSVIRSVTQRIEAITNLLVKDPYNGEMYQVANYGIGGLYLPHYDYFELDTDSVTVSEIGNRLATLMIYLTDVTAGGGTAFPRSGVTLWPERGAAALWYNLYSDGNTDADTVHGACSVLHGSKWIMNKWIRMNSQVKNFPCGLKPYTRFHSLQ